MASDEERQSQQIGAAQWNRRQFIKRVSGGGASLVLGAGLFEFLMACSTSNSPAATSLTPKRGGHIVEGAAADLGSGMNPVVNNVTFDGHVQRLMFASLVTNTGTGELIPDLASALPKISPDGMTYTFTLRDGLKWSDGHPLTAEDAVFTFQTIFAPEYKSINSPYRSDLSSFLESVNAPDPKTVVFKLKKPQVSFTAIYGRQMLVPKHILGSVSAQEFNSGAFNRGPSATSSLFKFVEWVPGSRITLARNDNYWAGPTLLDGYVYKVVANESLKVQQLQTGEMDFGRITTGSTVAAIKGIPTVDVFPYETANGVSYVHQLDPAKPISKIFSDKQVRKALYTALDLKGMNQVYLGYGKVADTNWPYLSWAHNATPKVKYTYDPQKAAQMLDAAGWVKSSNGVRSKNGQEMRWELLTSASSKEWQNVAQVMQQNWKAIGVEITIKALEFGQLNQITIRDRSFEMSMAGGWFVANLDPDASNTWHSKNAVKGGGNVAPYINPAVDSLLDQAAQTSDQAKRKPLYAQIQDILMEDLPTPPMVLQPGFFAVNKRIHGMGPSEIGYFSATPPRPFMNKVWVSSGS
jgi:peptide/nickel transport system substrate-binding protein